MIRVAAFAFGLLMSAVPARGYSQGNFIFSVDLETDLGAISTRSDGVQVADVEVVGVPSKDLTEWINASFSRPDQRRSGEVHACDANYKAVATREFFDAWISELNFSKLDANSGEGFKLSLEIAAEKIVRRKGDGTRISGPLSVQHKDFTMANFNVDIDGLSTERVSKVDSLSIKQTVVKAGAATKAAPQVSDLKLHINRGDLATWKRADKKKRREGKLVIGKGKRGCTVNLHDLRLEGVTRPGKRNKTFVATLSVGGLTLDCK